MNPCPPPAWSLALALSACGPGEAPAGNDESTGKPAETTTTTTVTTSTTGAPDPTTGIVGDDTTALPGTTGCLDTCTTSNDGSTFIIPTDIPMGGKVECDNWAQDCPPGQKCSAYASGGGTSWDSLKCVPVAENPKQPGELCMVEGNGVSGIDDCDLGSYCWDTDAENVGYCVALCKGTPETAFCEDPDATCAIWSSSVLSLCLNDCDPLAQDCVHPKDMCIGNPTGAGFLCILDASGEEGQQHDPCEYVNECDPGLICLDPTAAVECDPNATGCCQPYCDLTDPDADANCGGEGQVCNPYYEEGVAPPGQEHIGYCALPP